MRVRPRTFSALLAASKASYFGINAYPDPAFRFNADPDPAPKNNADSEPQP
jgi:hypothetical protein